MERETTTLTTPSGREVVIYTQTTRKDDRLAEAALNAGIQGSGKAGSDDVDLSFSPAAIAASTEIYVRRLTKTIDGKPVTDEVLDDLLSPDYDAIESAVEGITRTSAVVDPKDTPAV